MVDRCHLNRLHMQGHIENLPRVATRLCVMVSVARVCPVEMVRDGGVGVAMPNVHYSVAGNSDPPLVRPCVLISSCVLADRRW